MTGSVLQINVSRGGLPKLPVPHARLQATGVEGDGHAHPQVHGGARQAVLVIAGEALDQLKALGFPIFPGALGENITTSGLDRREWRIGQRFRIGDEAVIEFTKVRVPCQSALVYGAGIAAAMYDERVHAGDTTSPRWCMGGIYALVTTPGIVRPGDSVVAYEQWSA